MIRAGLADIASVVNATGGAGNLMDIAFEGVSIDSRTVVAGNLFVAIRGRIHDGHKYISEAIRKGAAAVIADNSYTPADKSEKGRVLHVADTLQAMHSLASWWLSRIEALKIAVTGTNGKTTTKEMIALVLSKKFNVYRSPGNLNNLYGVPLSIFGMDESCEMAVFEFGMSTPGEIATLTELVRPDYGVITNVDAAHLETMLTVEAIAKAKFELLDNMSKDGTVFLNVDNEYLRRRYLTESRQRYGFGIREESDFTPERFEFNGTGCARFSITSVGDIHLHAPGMHNLYNAVAAIAVGSATGVPREGIRTALESFKPVEMRMETVKIGGVLIIDDSYNANPASMRFALETLEAIKSDGRKIAVLGDMFELGEQSALMHKEIGLHASKHRPDLLVTCGKLANNINKGAAEGGCPPQVLKHFTYIDEMADWLLDEVTTGDTVLIKASRGMEFDRIANRLKEELEGRG